MREILFRGKRKDNNNWIYGGIVHQTDFYGDKCDRWFIIDGTDTHDYDIGYGYEVIPETVGQFTGLKDKNGVRIFDGDIVKRKLDKDYIGIVKFGDILLCGFDKYNGWYVQLKENDYYTNIKLVKSEIFEIVGNIHDSPELLKK